MNKNTKVLIVGAGPVGMVLASQLKHYDINVDIIEKRVDFTNASKALSINPASLKIFESMGILNKFLTNGKKVYKINLYWNGKPLIRTNYMQLECPYKFYLTLPQSNTEKILSDHLQSLNCNISRQVTLTSLAHVNDGVEVTLKYANGVVKIEHYDYVVGCDGSRSQVRNCLGKKFEGHDYNMYFLLIDVELAWDGLKGETHYYVKEDGFIIVIPLSNSLHRIVIKKNGNIEDIYKKVTFEDYQEIINYYGPGNIWVKNIIWESSAPFYNRLSASYRENRIFLAGDAAHLFSPIGGMGMNTGIQDAFNLAWKLAGVIHGAFNSNILDSYENERLQIAKQLIYSTDVTTKLITRIDQDSNGALQSWMPIMQNRLAMKRTWALNFSGLGQQYDNSSFVVGHNINDNSSLAPKSYGGHVPYFEVDNNNKEHNKSSYCLVKGYLPIILIFCGNKTNQLLDFLNGIEHYNLQTIIVSKSDIEIDKVDSWIDKRCYYYQKFAAKCGDVFLLRPDGYIGCQSHISKLQLFKDYLNVFLLIPHSEISEDKGKV